MNDDFITEKSNCLTINKCEYLSQLSFSSSRIRQDKKIELDMKQEYSGRELYEMIQNADDEGSPRIELELTEDNYLHIKNWGNRPFTEGGLLSIMRSFLSTKTDAAYKNATVKPIGNKGLGFRSLLNWSDEITIHSNGVQCSFSEEIARNEWNAIKQTGITTGCLSEKDLHSFEQEHYEELPLPILSIPKISKDTITHQNHFDINDACTTDIEVHCKELSIVSDIEQKLHSLPSSVLLFLRNIKQIDIICKRNKRTIQRLETNDIQDKYPQTITIIDNNHEVRFVVNRYLSDDRSFEVGVAYPLTKIATNRVLYSYFPTQVRLDVPAIYHGTFELNASRNHLVDTVQNKKVLEKLGEVATQLSNYLTSNGLLEEHNKWDSFNLLNLPNSDIESAKLSPLAESIQSNLDSANIFPVVKSVFSNIGSTLKIGDKLASWLINVQGELHINESLSNHIIKTNNEKVFSPERYLSNYVLSKIKRSLDDSSEWLEEIARQTMTIEQRADLIDAITECGICVKKLSILIDAAGTIIDANKDNPSYILSMKGNSVLPECLHVRSVDSELVNMLQRKWNVQIRQVTEMLKPVTTVADGDHYTLRRRIESWSSSQQMDIEGMREVLKWEFHNPTQDSTPFTSDMYLINKNGEKRSACDLILEEPSFPSDLAKRIGNKWWLKYSLSEWKKILEADTEDETADFLHKVLGVSQRVPVLHLYYGNKDKYLEDVRDSNNKSQIGNNYCDNFGVNNKITKQYNYAYVPEEDFLSIFSLSEALGLILTDNRVFQDIMNNNISLFYRSSKTETVQRSYSAYSLRFYNQFSPLQKSVIYSSVFGCDIDFDYLEKTLSIDRITKINPLLVSLGAQTSINNFTLEQLYSLLSQEVNSVGIQKRYKELREAIRNKDEEGLIGSIRTKYLTHVWARIQGQLKWLNVEDVYYWDNDQLPQTILSNLPKLEIGNRVGEDSVAMIFGVKLAKNIVVSFFNNIDNEILTKDLKNYLSERIKYFLAYRIGDDIKDASLIRQSVNALKNLSNNLHIYLSSSYSINGETHEMKDGDILTSSDNVKGGIHYYICSRYSNCINAIEDPVFCENLNEAVCMALKVTSNTMSNYFRNIITHDIRYIDYITKKDIAPEIRTLTLKSLGLSEFEQYFWETYSDTQETKIDINQLAEHITDERDYILSRYNYLALPEDYTGVTDMKPFEQYKLLMSMQVKDCSIMGADGLKKFYMDYFNAIRNEYSDQYNSFLYQRYANLIAGDKQKALDYIKEYQDHCQRFSDSFYKDKVEAIKLQLLKEEELTNIMSNMIKEKFKFEPKIGDLCIHNTILPAYEKILSDYHLSEGNLDQLDILIAKFEGLEDLFNERLKNHLDSDLLERNNKEFGKPMEQISIGYANCHSILRDISSDINNKEGRKSNGRYASDREKYHTGKKAEFATFEAMKDSPLFEDVFGHSSILNKEGGNDNLHYDISYRKKGTPKTDTRYLEVKAMSGDSIIMSCMEYQFAKEHCEQYDFAIYHDGKISIIESPFSTKNGKKCLEVQPETYQITLEWN